MGDLCRGRVVVVTGAGRGIGREYALEFARQGARVVVNDLGSEVDGSGTSTGPAAEVVDLIRSMGVEAVANGEDVATWDGAERLIATAVEVFGGLDVLVNNAGILRPDRFAEVTEEDWDAVIRVHLKGHFCPARHAVAYWVERHAAGLSNDARIINTSSAAGLMGSIGLSAYVAAKAGIAALTITTAAELAPYGITVNAICPTADTRMKRSRSAVHVDPVQFDPMAPANIAPLVVWVGSTQSSLVTGRVFEVGGGAISIADGWRHGTPIDNGARWDPADIGPALQKLLAHAQVPEQINRGWSHLPARGLPAV
jgi:NAD(P)-dependent dehydrogenase (short-subunit alcohol dehydrogenase family)